MYPTRLGLTWHDRIAFVLNEKLQIKRLEFLEMSNDSTAGDELDEAEQFDIDFAVMAGELAKLLDDVVAALGTQAQEQAAAA
jgi:recombination associated protein RdgC